MTAKRVSRVRVGDFQPKGGAASALSRRTGRGKVEARIVVPYFGDDADTPMTELLKAVRGQSQSFRSGEYVHVSDVISKCIRRIALMRRLNMRHPQESIPDGQAITFAIGEALHDFVKAKFTKGHPDKVWAEWKCACGETSHIGTFASRPKKTCDDCGMPVDKHHEVPFVHQLYMLKGTPDLLLWFDEYGAFYIIEIKSIAAAAWKELTRPLPDHTVQIALYWHILKALGHPVVDKVSVLYVNKEYSFKLPYKEFMIDPTKVDLSIYWQDLEDLNASVGDGPLPARVLCGTADAPEAKKCPVCATCFGCE